jgi:hypothetical protein
MTKSKQAAVIDVLLHRLSMALLIRKLIEAARPSAASLKAVNKTAFGILTLFRAAT